MTSTTITKNVLKTFTCSGSLLNTESISWSEDNCISMIINKGVYVFESRFDPSESASCFPLHMNIILNPTETMVFDVGIEPQLLLSSCSLDEQHLLMLDHSLIPETSNSANFKSFRICRFSPVSQRFGSLLVLLTLDHRIIIYRRDRLNWVLAMDLTHELNEQIKSTWDSIETKNVSVYKERIYSVASMVLCWANSFTESDSGQNCVLFVGSKNGLITFWQVSLKTEISVELIFRWETKYGQIVNMKCFDDFLIVSAFSGIVVILYSGFCYDDQPNPLLLWSEEDEIPVHHFQVKRLDEQTLDVIFIKATFIIVARVEVQNTSESITLILKVCKSFPGIHQMPSTGICKIIDSKFLVTSMDGRLIEISILPDLQLTQSIVNVEGMNQSGMCSYGIDSSPNGVLCCVAQHLSVYYDHLVIKEPIQMVVFANITFNETALILQEQYISTDPSVKLTGIAQSHDYLDCLRAYLGTNQYSPPESLLLASMNDENEIKACEDAVKLRLTRFIAMTFAVNCQTKISDVDQLVLKARAELCEELILKLYVNHLLSCFALNAGKSSVLTKEQMASLRNMNSWLNQQFQLQLIKFEFDCSPELCPICKNEIKFENRTFGSCLKSHQFVRCTNSLLICDVAKYKYEKCVRCAKSILIKPPIWKEFSVCIYCY